MPYNSETSRSVGVMTLFISLLAVIGSLAYFLEEGMFLVRKNITAPGDFAVLICFKLLRFSKLVFIFLG